MRSAVLLVLLLLPVEGPVDTKAHEAVAEEWFKATPTAREEIAAKAAALPPLPAEAVKPLSEKLFALAKRNGRRLPLKSGAFLYPETKEAKETGKFLIAGAKPKGGLLIAMHGGGENSGDAGSAMGIWGGAGGYGLTVIAPQAMDLVSSAWNQHKDEHFVLDLIDAARRTLDIDTNRVYLAGHSMGGDGSWMLGGRNADRIAACAPLAGSVMPYMRPGKDNRIDTPLSDYEGLTEGVLPNLMHLRYWIYHSADDRNEAVHPDDMAVERLKGLQARFPGKYDFKYDRVDGMKHALPKGGVKPILEWITKFRREPHPPEVVWETWWPEKTRMYWLRATGHSEKFNWRWHAKVTGPNAVEVSFTTKPSPGFTAPKERELEILLSPKLFDLDKPLKVTSGGKTLFEGPVTRSFAVMLTTIGDRNDPEQWYEGSVKVVVQRKTWWDLWDEEPKR
jgi:pimeloyl-ACP methyl ester carboxylesterase